MELGEFRREREKDEWVEIGGRLGDGSWWM